jgi:hypothetical protein
MSIRAKNIRCCFIRKKSSVFTFFDELYSARKFWESFITHNALTPRSSDHSQRARHLNQFQETLGTRKKQFPEKRSAGKNRLFFFLFDVLTLPEIQADF